VAAQQTQDGSRDIEIPEAHVRLMPRHPLGGQANLTAMQLTDLGAQASALGMERSAVTGFVHDVQTLAADVALQAASRLMERVRDAQVSRLNTLAQDIKALQGAPPPGFFDSMSPNAALIRSGYVSRESVLALVQKIMAASPRT
jgi:hypothetical protein